MNKKQNSEFHSVSTERENEGKISPGYCHAMQNFVLIWLDRSIDETNNADCRNSITKLRQIVNTIYTFTEFGECVEFMSIIKAEKVFMIASGSLGQTTVPVIHEKPQLSTIYIFCQDKDRHQEWAQQWPKIKGVFTDITSICEALKQVAEDCDQNSIPISFVATNDSAHLKKKLDQLDQSFMYTQILKEILLTIDFEEKHIRDFLAYCREQFIGNSYVLENVTKFESEYHCNKSIWWYTYNCFLHSMLNKALRIMELDVVIKMGFFIRDLHNNIAKLHSEQYVGKYGLKPFTVYRGQCLSSTVFNRLIKTRDGLLSFNNFLSTSRDKHVSLKFIHRAIEASNLIGILFHIIVDPSICSTPFADICNVSAYKEEEEILFSMHSVFRIGQINQIDGIKNVWCIKLELTNDNDSDLHALMKHIREETFPDETGWYRLGSLLLKLGRFEKAQQVYNIMLDQISSKREEASLYQMLGQTKDLQGEYVEAINFYERSLEISKRILPSNHSHLAAGYTNIGLVYYKMSDYSKALFFHRRAIKILQETPSPNHRHLAASYNSIGLVYKKIDDCSMALTYYEKALEINQKNLPSNHPNLATSYSNIGLVHKKMNEYLKALSCYQKALEIWQEALPPYHPDVATVYNNIGSVYSKLGKNFEALSSHEKALEIRKTALPEDHPDLAQSYEHIGMISSKIGDHSKAVLYCKRALTMLERLLPLDHPDIQLYRGNLEKVKSCE